MVASNYLKKMFVSASVAALGFALPAFADTTSDAKVQELEAKIQQLMQEVGSIKKAQQRASAPAGGASDDRLEALETAVDRLDERVGSRGVVNAFDAVDLDLGGFLHTTLTHAQAEDNTATSFNRTVFELLLKAQLGDEWSAFIAQAFIRESDPNFSANRRTVSYSITAGPVMTDTPLAWGNYRYSDAAQLRFGRLLTPHGIINIEHFPAILLDPEQPQFLRPFGGATIFPNFLTGVQFHGETFLGSNKLAYSAYAGNFTGNDEELVVGARGAYTFTDYGLTLGANISQGERSPTASSNYSMYGLDAQLSQGRFGWRNEVFWTSEDQGRDRLGWYTEPSFALTDKWTVFGRYDFLKSSTGEESTEHVLGLNFKPVDNVRLRATATQRMYDLTNGTDPQATLYQFSATLNF